MVSFLQSLLLLFHFCIFLSQLSELVWKLAEEISLQSASKRFPSFGPPANGNKSNAKKSRFRPNRNSTGTIYHWSVILRSFSVVSNSAKRDANGFFKVLLLSSRHPIQNSKFGACAVTRYCSFKYKPYEKQMKGSKHLCTPDCMAILVFTVFVAQARYCRCFVWLISVTLNVTSPLSFSRTFDGVIQVCSSLSASN